MKEIDIKNSTDPYISKKFIYEDLGICRTTFWKLRKSGDYPPPEKLGSTTIERWRLSTHINWKEANREVQS